MENEQWKVVEEVQGMLQAEILRGLLEAQGISVYLSQEGIGRVYGLTVGPLGRVQILVPDHEVERAEKILEEYEAGTFEERQWEDDLPDTDAETPLHGGDEN